MRKIAAFASCFIAFAEAPATAAEKCPVGDIAAEKAGGYANAVKAALEDAPNCERAYKALAACQLGSSGDNALSDIVRSKCEPLFLVRASPATKQAYKKARQRCDKIAERNEGSMYQGFAAVCQAGAARDFARQYARRR
ncbi:hypothetical protein Msil_0087 [Methylocella silvestris BL2]|uniref:Uncharacterized protein n=1 Tax=Methylocella silvestris (strain DSM 15510 / CIP 108128 / LMG 27833 / NCIMB 13906 / BL2) TaxID=395965 RepID=B8EL75_METSB|nr:hypothetical protein [Methylocella silvestris]ACK49070.1 hypothetical protein Msil_0087 [Methylocella silvestris BL2]